jgi:hypothetical protein
MAPPTSCCKGRRHRRSEDGRFDDGAPRIERGLGHPSREVRERGSRRDPLARYEEPGGLRRVRLWRRMEELRMRRQLRRRKSHLSWRRCGKEMLVGVSSCAARGASEAINASPAVSTCHTPLLAALLIRQRCSSIVCRDAVVVPWVTPAVRGWLSTSRSVSSGESFTASRKGKPDWPGGLRLARQHELLVIRGAFFGRRPIASGTA